MRDDSRFWKWPHLEEPDPGDRMAVLLYLGEKAHRRTIIDALANKVAFALRAELEKEEKREPSDPT